jgi:hypothetical protein
MRALAQARPVAIICAGDLRRAPATCRTNPRSPHEDRLGNVEGRLGTVEGTLGNVQVGVQTIIAMLDRHIADHERS